MAWGENAVSSCTLKSITYLFLQSPTYPLLKITDIRAVAEIARKNEKLHLVVDNTFMSPYLQNPLDLGAHIVLHSVTKYIGKVYIIFNGRQKIYYNISTGGHSDVVMGVIVTKDDEIYR